MDVATLANVLNLNSFNFHHCKGSVSLVATFSAKYWFSSALQLLSEDSSSSPRSISKAFLSSCKMVKLQQTVLILEQMWLASIAPV